MCVHEGVNLLRERKSWSNRKQLVLNEAFDFPALENPMLSRWQQSEGKLLAQYVAWLVTQKQLIVLSASLSSAAAIRCSTILKIDIYEVD